MLFVEGFGMKALKTIHSLFEVQVERTPDKIAIHDVNRPITYRVLNEKANQLGHYLKSKGVGIETPVAFCMERTDLTVSVLLGILKAGGAYVPLDPSHPEERLLSLLNDTAAPVLIISSLYKTKFESYLGQIIVIDHDQEIAKLPKHNLNIEVNSRNLAYIIFTSGSTGVPKGVLIEHKSVVNYAKWFASYTQFDINTRIDFSANCAFDMAVSTSIIPLMHGLQIVVCDDSTKNNSRHFLKYLQEKKINLIKITPSYFRVLFHEIKNNPLDLSDLQFIILGGENLPSADCAAWLSIYPNHRLFNEYGPTETTVAVSQFEVTHENLHELGLIVPIGKPAPEVCFFILDSNHHPLAKGKPGELGIGGPCLARGYLKQPEKTEKTFIQVNFDKTDPIRLYKSGDLCQRDFEGDVHCFGRIDDQVKIRGYRVEPGEIEACIKAFPGIKGAIVIPQESRLNEKRLIAYYTIKNKKKAINFYQLRRYLQNHLPDYMIPYAFIKVSVFPLTSNGKLDRSSLPVPQFTTGDADLSHYTAVEKILIDIWSEELETLGVGLDDDFFELGGHSLSAARIISKINFTLGKEISLNEFYRASCIRRLAPLIQQGLEKDDRFISEANISSSEEIEPNHPSKEMDSFPLSDFQLMLWLSSRFAPKARKLNVFIRKRFEGTLNKAALCFAFEALIKKHEVFSFHISKFSPFQKPQKDLPFKLIEEDLSYLALVEKELTLNRSIDKLIYCADWPKNTPLLIVKLFELGKGVFELQFAMPHIILDDFSSDIILSDLSKFYLLYQNQSSLDGICKKPQLKNFIGKEQDYFAKYLNRDILFWEDYLKDARLFSFPLEQVVSNMEAKKLSYSTYTAIPQESLETLQQFCIKQHVSLNDGLCATLALALFKCCKIEKQKNCFPLFINAIKSTRDDQRYDNTIGCFLRLEPLLIKLSENSSLSNLSKQIQNIGLETNSYQRCPSLIKLASIKSFKDKRNSFKSRIVRTLIYLYSTIFSLSSSNRKILGIAESLSAYGLKNNFLISLNVQSNFISGGGKKNAKNLFGLKLKEIKIYYHDLLKIDNFFEVCFMRDGIHNTPYLVISSNIKPQFRELISQEMMRIISTAMA